MRGRGISDKLAGAALAAIIAFAAPMVLVPSVQAEQPDPPHSAVPRVTPVPVTNNAGMGTGEPAR